MHKIFACTLALICLVLSMVVTPAHAGGRSLRSDNPGVACDFWKWGGDTMSSSDMYSTQDGNAVSFSPGTTISGPLNFCSPSESLVEIWESPSQQSPSTNVEAFTQNANAASVPVASGPGEGLPTDLYWTATTAFMYEWVDNTTPMTGENPQAELIVWTLPNTTDLEFEFYNWCLTQTTASFTWNGNKYTAVCNVFSGDDLMIDQNGLPDGYVTYPDNVRNTPLPGALPTEWSVEVATYLYIGALQWGSNSYQSYPPPSIPNNTPFTLNILVRDADSDPITTGPIQVSYMTSAGTVTVMSNVVNGNAAFNIRALTTGLYTFTATYLGQDPYAFQSVPTTINLTVDPPLPTVSIGVSPTTILLGQSATLTWSSTNANAGNGNPSCTASGAWSGGQGGSGTSQVTPTATGSFTYTLTCSDFSNVTNTSPSASATATLTVTAPPAPVVTVNVAPSTIAVGQSATLTWSSTNATTCSANSAWSGAQATSGMLTLTPTVAGGFAYSLTCTGAGGTGNGATALIVSPTPGSTTNAPTVIVTISPTTITVGQSATLTWTSANATTCTADSAWGGAKATSGTLSVSPTATGGYAYSLTCTGAGGTTNGATALSVTPAPPSQSSLPTVTISLNPATITLGQSATLTWSTTNATSCTADSAWSGVQATSGTRSVSPSTAGGYAYSLSCSGAAGTGNGAVGLSVVPAATAAPAPSKSGGGSLDIWELLALGGLLSWRFKRAATLLQTSLN